MEIAASTLVYAGLAAVFFGLVNVAWPLRWLRMRRRRTGLLILATGLLAVLGAMLLPPVAHAAAEPLTSLDEHFPAWEFAEHHAIRVHAPPARVQEAILGVTADEIFLFRLLTGIRNPGRSWRRQPDNILAPPPDRPILDVALSGGFVLLDHVPAREILVGAVVCCRFARVDGPEAFTALVQPGYAKAGMNFLLQDEGGGWTRVSTETRIHGTDPSAQRSFARYWRVIYPGSALIRRGWLRAIKARAEGARASLTQNR
jgi:hypothetical protein